MEFALYIRIAEPGDATAISQCVHNAYRHYVQRLGVKPGPMLDDYSQVISDHRVHVAEIDDRVIAVLVLKNTDSGVLLDNLAVDPAYQNRGVGGRLLNLAEKIAREHGYESIQLYTHQLMHENIEYYKKRDYKISHKITENGYQRIYMNKRLSPSDGS